MMQMSDYVDLFPGAARGKARFMALAEAVLGQATDLAAVTEELAGAYSFAGAVGVQLDAAAEAVGLRREAGMTDEVFRQSLLARLKRWTWDGTNEGAQTVLPEGVTVTDNQDGSVTVAPAGTDPALLPVPAGIRIR